MAANEEHEDAEALIKRVKAMYSSCRSYADRGQLTSILPQDEGEPLVSYQTFSTVFVRPDKFRFEFRDRFPEGQFGRHVVWRESNAVKTWRYQFHPKVKFAPDLSLALAGATGLSHGVAVTIPQLLLPQEINARGLFSEDQVEWVGNEECQDRACAKISSRGAIGYFVWIEIETGLILRVEERTAISYQTSGWSHSMTVGKGNLTSRTVISYRPAINCEIPVSQMEFGEPFSGYGDDVEVIG